MDFALTPDQAAILDAVDALTRRFTAPPLHDTSFAVTNEELERELSKGGFLDIGFDPDLGAVAAALLVERLARLPYAVEAATSAVLRPLLGEAAARPVCVVEAGRPTRLVRFLRPGATVVVVGERVTSFIATEAQVQAERESLYAYPMATLLAVPGDAAALDLSPGEVRTRWRVAVAAEGAGLLAAALASAVTYVTDRQQFGRPIATFQAVRHRLAEAQVRANGTYWLALKAAATLDPGDAALALLHVQQSATAAAYDDHQFLGAMGMTLEHPLHLWTYRLKALVSELGGRGAQGLAAAGAIWGR